MQRHHSGYALSDQKDTTSAPRLEPANDAWLCPRIEQSERQGDDERQVTQKPQPGPHLVSWQATLWSHHIQCHEVDRHIYLDDWFLDLTPIEFCLFWLLLQHALQAHDSPRMPLRPSEQEMVAFTRYLRQVGIVPTTSLLHALVNDLGTVMARWYTSDRDEQPTVLPARLPGARSSLTSHLDRLRSKLRCHGLDIGTVLLCGRAARGYMLCPLGIEPSGAA